MLWIGVSLWKPKYLPILLRCQIITWLSPLKEAGRRIDSKQPPQWSMPIQRVHFAALLLNALVCPRPQQLAPSFATIALLNVDIYHVEIPKLERCKYKSTLLTTTSCFLSPTTLLLTIAGIRWHTQSANELHVGLRSRWPWRECWGWVQNSKEKRRTLRFRAHFVHQRNRFHGTHICYC